jgi:hypothetical protein
MGAGNVALVLSNWATLPDAAFRVLVQMALTGLDKDSPPKYYGGRSPLLHAMGREKHEPADFQALKRAIASLVDTGAISVDNYATKHRPATYSLHLWGTPGVPVERKTGTPGD